MDGWTDERMDGRIDGWTDGLMHPIDGRTDGRKDGWIRWTDEQMNG